MNHQKNIAIIDAVRTPFARSFGAYGNLTPVQLGNQAVKGLLQKTSLPPSEIDEMIAGTVISDVQAPNLAREICFELNMPLKIPGYTLGRACASSLQSVISAAEGITAGSYETVVSVGSESLSNVPVMFSKKFVKSLLQLRGLGKAKTPVAKAAVISKFLSDFKINSLTPVMPGIAERYTGLTMGQHAEIMAKKNQISRESQDDFALRSHMNAAKATEDGRLSEEIIPVFLKNGEVLDKDDGIRSDTSIEKLQRLKPVFDRKYGTVTAANSSPLTDGASAALIMKSEKARAMGMKPKGYIRAWASSALDPNDQLLLAPAISTPMALKKAGLTMKDIGLFEFHEAFASQVLSVTKNLASREFASKYMNSSEAVGEVDPEILNVKGGSISIGHPFGATGIRLIASALNEMKIRNVQFGLITACAAGGLGTTMVLELDC